MTTKIHQKRLNSKKRTGPDMRPWITSIKKEAGIFVKYFVNIFTPHIDELDSIIRLTMYLFIKQN